MIIVCGYKTELLVGMVTDSALPRFPWISWESQQLRPAENRYYGGCSSHPLDQHGATTWQRWRIDINMMMWKTLTKNQPECWVNLISQLAKLLTRELNLTWQSCQLLRNLKEDWQFHSSATPRQRQIIWYFTINLNDQVKYRGGYYIHMLRYRDPHG